MKTNYEKPKWTDKWGYIKSVKLEVNLVCIEQKGGWMTYEQFGSWNTKQGSDKALNLYNSIILSIHWKCVG